MLQSVINTLVWAAILQGFLLGVYYIFSGTNQSNKYLGFFILTLMIEAFFMFLPIVSIGSYQLTYYFSSPEVKIFFPTLFYHFVFLKLGKFPNKQFLQIQYSLAFFFAFLTIINIGLHLFTGKNLLSFFSDKNLELIFYAQQYYALFISIVLIIISFIETVKYERKVKNEYSDYTLLEIKWLWQFLISISIIAFLWTVELVLLLYSLELYQKIDFVSIMWAAVIVFIYFVSYKAIKHKDPIQLTDQPEAKPITREIKSDFPENLEKIANKIAATMEKENHFLDHNLTLHDFAKATNTSSRIISQCVNNIFKLNFSEWVNNYRVEYAIKSLNDPNSDHLSIEGIGQDSGFKSRSAMYTAFKKKTGKTPGNFRV